MNNSNNFLNYHNFDDFYTLAVTKFVLLATSQKRSSPNPKYFFKIFRLKCNNAEKQKIILDTFYQICRQKSQYLLSYKHLAFSFKNKLYPTFSMKFIQSKRLDQVLKTPNLLQSIKIESIMRCLFAVAEGMAHLHNHLTYHGNLCPSNIIIDEADQFYLCDFGLYPIKKIYMEESEIFNNDYRDPFMDRSGPVFKNDVYSYGVLMCELFLNFLKVRNEINQNETLQNFLKNANKNKFNVFPPFCVELIQSCLSSFVSERPSFNKILEIFKTTKHKIFGIEIQSLFDEFSKSNYLLTLAMKNNTFALNKLAGMYKDGKTVEKNHQRALEFYKKAAELGNSKAQNNYGVMLQEYSNGNDSDMIEGVRYLQKSAEQKNIHGMANYGIALLKGKGVEKNIQKAEEYLKKSADLGYSYAQVNYGYTLLDNNPTLSGINEGLCYIKKAINQNNSDAYYTYGVILQEGKHIEKNEKLAMEYFKTASDMGHNDATYKCAECYMDGNGVQKNDKIALKYFQILYDKNGDKKIKSIIDTLTNKIENANKKNISIKKIITNDLMPSKVSPKLNLISLGKVVIDRPNYHKGNIIYPVGYQTEREYISFIDPTKQTIYCQSILDGGTHPIFRVVCKDNEDLVFEGPKPLTPWKSIHEKIIEAKKRMGIAVKESMSISGPKQFGLTLSVINRLIHNLPNASDLIQSELKNEEDYDKSDDKSDDDITYLNSDDISNSPDKISNDLIKKGDHFLEKKDEASAFECYKEAAKRNNVNAYLKCAELSSIFESKLYYYDLAIQKNVPEAFSKWRKAVLDKFYLSNHDEQNTIVKIFLTQEDYSDAAYFYKMAKNESEFLIYYDKAKKNIDNIKNGEQQYLFALCAQEQNDLELSLDMFQKAFQNGASQAKEKINELISLKDKKKADTFLNEGIDYYEGTNGKENDVKKAFELLKEASKIGCPKADYYISIHFNDENGTSNLRKAAKCGDAESQYWYGNCLINENHAKAMHYLKLAADQGHVKAAFEYGKDKFDKKHNDDDEEEGISYIKKAAEKEHPDALYIYSKIIENSDPQESQRLYKLSLEKRSHLAIEDQNKRLQKQQTQNPKPANEEEEDIITTDSSSYSDFDDDDNDDDDWGFDDREKLQKLLLTFGWGRWDVAKHSFKLFKPVKLEARAFLRYLLSIVSHPKQFKIANMLLKQSYSTEFDSNFVNQESAEATDNKFMKHPSMSDPQYVQFMKRNSQAWLNRIEFLYYIRMTVEEANRNIDEINVPKYNGSVPMPWWTIENDKMLLYGTWKFGYDHYDEFVNDSQVNFLSKITNKGEYPQLTSHLKKLVDEIKKSKRGRTNGNEVKAKLWSQKDKSIVIQKLLHEGVNLKSNGDYDWMNFRLQCQFTDKTDDQVRSFVEDLVRTEGNQDEDDKINNIKDHFNTLTRLRRINNSLSKEELVEYLTFRPRWANLPKDWTAEVEGLFIKRIAMIGWDSYTSILKEKPFSDIFRDDPPLFLTQDNTVIELLKPLISFIETHTLVSLRKSHPIEITTNTNESPGTDNNDPLLNQEFKIQMILQTL